MTRFASPIRFRDASITITLDLYSHVAPRMPDDAAEKLSAIVFCAP
jgi:hypothetical protein